jgi:hypothetical protein
MMMRHIVITLLTMCLLCGGAVAQTNYVVRPDGSGDAPTIQAAIDMAVSGDGISVWGGDYYEDDILVDGKDLYFQYQGSVPVIISSSYRQGTGITFRNTGMSTNLLGFEFKGFATGISIENSSGMYWYCIVTDCGTGIEVSGPSAAPSILFMLADSCDMGTSVLGGSNVSLRNMTVVGSVTGFESVGGSSSLSRSIIYGCDTGALCSGGSVSLSCNNFHLNTVNYSGCSAGTDDFYDLTRFCFEAEGSPGPYHLHADSPCWAANNACGVDVGVYVTSPGCTGTAVEETSWGAIKKIYR